YALTTHCSELVDIPRSVRIDGSATPTIETSIASRKMAPQRTSSMPRARAPRRWAAFCPEAFERLMASHPGRVRSLVPECDYPGISSTRLVRRRSDILHTMSTNEVLRPAPAAPARRAPDGPELRRR